MRENCFIGELHTHQPHISLPFFFFLSFISFEILCSSGCPEIHYVDETGPESPEIRPCLCLLGVGVKDIYHHTQLVYCLQISLKKRLHKPNKP